MRTDGSVIIDTKIIDDGMEKGFDMLKDDVSSIGAEADKVGEKIKKAFSDADVSKPVADAARRIKDLEQQLAAVTAEHRFAIAEDDDNGAEQLARKMSAIYDRLEKARERLATEVEKEAQRQAKAEEKAAERSRKAAEKEAKAKEQAAERSRKAAEKEANRTYREATRGVRRFGSRLSEILSGALIFNVISSGVRSLTSYLGDALKANEAYRQAVGKLKGAFLTAFQPIYEYVLPGIVEMVNHLTVGAQALAQFFATISGKSVRQMSYNAEQLHNEAKGMDAVAESTEEAKRQLMGFDEINKLSQPKTQQDSSGADIGATDNTIAPIFEDFTVSEDIMKDLERILVLVGAIGIGLALWKISSIFTDNLKLCSGLAFIVGSAFVYAYGFVDAFINGLDWGNLGMMLGATAVAVTALWLTFGPLAAAIGLAIGSLGLIVLALKEWIETGELSNEACVALVAGIVGIGGAIALLTGSWIPLLIAAVAGLFIGIVTKGEEIKAVLKRLSDWLWNIFGRDWTEVFGPVLGSIINNFVEGIREQLAFVRDMFIGVIDFIQGVFTGNWEKALNGLLNIGKSIVNSVIGIINKMISAVTSAINALFRLMSLNIKLPNGETIGWNLPQFKAPKIPYLATGAVIPPNAPFMAVLGDQKNGTNIEAPTDLIRQILREELRGTSDGETAALLRELISVVENIRVGDETIGRAAARYNRRASKAGGY